MKLKLIIGLLISVFSVIFLVFWDGYQSKKDEQLLLESKKILNLEISDVQTIALSSHNPSTGLNEEYTIYKNKDNLWEVKSDFIDLADQGAVASFLESVIDYKFSKEMTIEDKRWQEFGISEKSKRIRLEYLSHGVKRDVTLIIGSKLSGGYNTYVKLANKDPIYVGSQYISILTERTAMDFRLKTFSNIDVENLESFTFYAKSQDAIKMTKDGKVFQIVEPIIAQADQLEVNKFLKNINELNAVGFYEASKDDQEIFDLKKLEYDYKLVWQIQDQSNVLYFYKFQNHLWATKDLEKMVYRLPLEMDKHLNKSLLIFRNRNIFLEKFDEVSELKFNEVLYVKLKNQWKNALDGNIADKLVKELLIELELAKTSRFIEKNMYFQERQNKPSHEIDIKFSNKWQKIRFWRLKDTFLVEVSNRSQLFEVSEKFFDFLDPNKKESDHIH